RAGARVARAIEQSSDRRRRASADREAAPGAVCGFRSDAGVRETGGGRRRAVGESGHAGGVAQGARVVGEEASARPASQATRAAIVLRVDDSDGWIASRLVRRT